MSDNQNRQIFTITSMPLIDNDIPIGDPISILNGLNANDYAALLSASAKAKEQPLVSIEFKEILDVKATSLFLETRKNINIQNKLHTIFFDGVSLKTLLTSSSSLIFKEHKNMTCLCFVNNTYSNGIIFKKGENYYVLTSNSINTQYNQFIDIQINGKNLLRCSIFGIDNMSNLLIAMVNVEESNATYYQSGKVYTIINSIEYFNLDNNFSSIFNDQPNNGIDLFIVNHNLYNSPTIDKCLMLNNRYYGDIGKKSTIESILVSHRINKYEAGSLILDSDGKIVGCLTAAALSADSSLDKNISIGLPANFIYNFMNVHIQNLNKFWDITKPVSYNTNLLWSDINYVIKKSFLGISCYPFSLEDPDLSELYRLTHSISGIFIDGFIEYYNKTNYKISLNKSYGNNSDSAQVAQLIFNPILYGNAVANTESLLYLRSIDPNKLLILNITFYSVIAGKIITINLGRSENESSISKFLYEYGPDNTGNYSDITITYIYKTLVLTSQDSNGNNLFENKYITNNGLFYKEIIKSKLVAYYQSDGINKDKKIIIANKTLPWTSTNSITIHVYTYNSNDYDLSSYSNLAINARFPNTDITNVVPINMKFIIMYIISDVPGKIVFQKFNIDVAEVQLEYLPSFGFKRYEFTLTDSTTFKLYYQNGNLAQTLFKMETFIANDYNILLQQTTQIPYPLIVKNAENFGQYIYSNKSLELTDINSKNYIL
jgi:hypothetical protein